jgi:hypothetical protein
LDTQGVPGLNAAMFKEKVVGEMQGESYDAIITLTEHETAYCATVDVIARNFIGVEPFVVIREPGTVLFKHQPGLDPTKLKRKDGTASKSSADEKALADLIPVEGINVKEWEAAAKEELKMSGTQFKKMRQDKADVLWHYVGGQKNRWFKIEQSDDLDAVVELGERILKGEVE